MRRGFTLIELLVVIAIIVILVHLLIGGADWLFQLIGHITLGWVWFLGRVIPAIHPSPSEVVSAAVALAIVVIGVHAFCRWLYRATVPETSKEWPWRRTLRVVGLIVLMFAAGTVAVGIAHQTAWLITSPEPLLNRSGHRLGGRMASANHLKQIAIALHSHADTHGNLLPASTFTSQGRPHHSWQTALLPYIEQDNLHKQIKFDRNWDHPDNSVSFAVRIQTYQVPTVNDDLVDRFGPSHYAANVLALGGNRPKRLPVDFPQGTSNVVFAGEATTNVRAWGDPLNWRDPRLGVNSHPDGFNGPFSGGINVVMGDGSVRFVTSKQAKGLLDGKFDDD